MIKRATEMTVTEFGRHLKANRDKLFRFWAYRTEQRRGTGTQVSSPTIKAAMQRRKAK